MKKSLTMLAVAVSILSITACSLNETDGEGGASNTESSSMRKGKGIPDPTNYPESDTVTTVMVNEDISFKVNYRVFDDFDSLPDEITVERQTAQAFTRPEGDTHYYEAVYVPTENVSWVQAAILAESVGGYLASITSEEENTFVFSLINDEKFFWEFYDGYTLDSHYNIKIGPFLGGVKLGDSTDSTEGWVWLSGEEWDYTNWAVNLDDGVIDKDPRPNDQPNGRGMQRVMGYGELNVPVDTWGDYFQGVAQFENMHMPMGYNKGFIIEYDTKPNN